MRRCAFAFCPATEAAETVTLTSGAVLVVCQAHRDAVLTVTATDTYRPRHAA